MTTDIKELVDRLREVFVEDRGHGHTTEWTRNLDGPEAADALEAMAGEVASLKLSNDLFQGAQKKEAEMNTQLTVQLHAVRAERDRLKAVLKPRLNAKAIEGLQEILEAMEAMDEREAPFLKTLLDWHEASRKALGDAS